MRVRTRTIPKGRAGTLETLRAIFQAIERGQVDPRIIRFTRDAIRGTNSSNQREMVGRIVAAWLDHVEILEDSVRHEFVQDADVTLAEGFGDCDDLAAGIGASIEHVGIPVELVVASNTPGGREDFTHVWLRALIREGGRDVWLPVDPRAMVELGFRLGQELDRSMLTALERFGWNENRGTLVMGQSLGNQNGALGQTRLALRRRRIFPGARRPRIVPDLPIPIKQRFPGSRAAVRPPVADQNRGRPRRQRRRPKPPLLSTDVATQRPARPRCPMVGRTLQDRLRVILEREGLRPGVPGSGRGAVPIPSDTIRQLQREAGQQLPGRPRRFFKRGALGQFFPFIEADRVEGRATAEAGERTTETATREIVSEREQVESVKNEKADTFVKRAAPTLAVLTALFLGTGIFVNLKRGRQ